MPDENSTPIIPQCNITYNTRIPSSPIIHVCYHNLDIVPIEQKSIGDWIDLRAAEDVVMKAGEYRIISLGVSMQLPEGYEAHVLPRSSTFKNFGIIMTNSEGIIDNSYCGQDDIWGFPALALRDTTIHLNDRICQFRIMPVMGKVDLITVAQLNSSNRGGFGSTGTK